MSQNLVTLGRLGHFNIYHILGKLLELSLILNHNFHIFGIAESRLSKSISNEDISIDGFRVFGRDPNIRQETGILVYFSDSLRGCRRQDLQTSDI